MTKTTTFIFIILSFAFFSCSNKNKSLTNNEVVTETIVEIVKPSFERLPTDSLQKFFNICNGMDIVLYNSDKTLNLWDDNVKHVLSMITNEAPLQLNDNIIGHIMMLKDGIQLAFVEVSIKGTDNYVIYNIADKKYYNKLNAKGLEFFSKF